MEARLFKTVVVFIVLTTTIYAQMLSRTKIDMGTFITISVDEKDKHYLEDGFNIVKEIDLSISSYNKNAQIYKLNRDKLTCINSYTREALELSQKYYELSDGYFDITVGSITKSLYRFGEQERVPTSKELEEARVNFKGLTFNEKEAFLEKNIKVDLGGMGKGFAVDKIAKYYRTNKIDKAVISASGDIRCLDICSIDVQHPFKNETIISFKTFKKDLGISTSGSYNRYVASTKHNHLINPKSKTSQNTFVSITLISWMPNSDLDAYATAASVMPMKKAYEFLDSMDVAYIVLQSDKELRVSDNLSKYTNNLIIHNTMKK